MPNKCQCFLYRYPIQYTIQLDYTHIASQGHNFFPKSTCCVIVVIVVICLWYTYCSDQIICKTSKTGTFIRTYVQVFFYFPAISEKREAVYVSESGLSSTINLLGSVFRWIFRDNFAMTLNFLAVEMFYTKLPYYSSDFDSFTGGIGFSDENQKSNHASCHRTWLELFYSISHLGNRNFVLQS